MLAQGEFLDVFPHGFNYLRAPLHYHGERAGDRLLMQCRRFFGPTVDHWSLLPIACAFFVSQIPGTDSGPLVPVADRVVFVFNVPSLTCALGFGVGAMELCLATTSHFLSAHLIFFDGFSHDGEPPLLCCDRCVVRAIVYCGHLCRPVEWAGCRSPFRLSARDMLSASVVGD
jgi:hypothetical protein